MKIIKEKTNQFTPNLSENIIDLKDATLNVESGVLTVSNVEFPCVVFHSIQEKLLVKKIIMQNKNIEFVADENSTSMGVFSDCEKLTEIVFSSSLRVVGESMFENCTSLEEINLPNSLISIELAGFNNCKRLRKLCLPQNLQRIEEESFSNCFYLQEIKIPKSLLNISDYAFENCMSVQKINIHQENLAYADYACNVIVNKLTKTLIFGCKNSSIPNSVQSIGANAFQNCCGLKEIKIPSSVKIIEAYAFSKCVNLEKIEMEEGLTEIDIYAFNDCKKLSNVTFPNSLTVIKKNAFNNCSSLNVVKINFNVEVQEPNWDLMNSKNLRLCYLKDEFDFSQIRISEIAFANKSQGLVLKDYNDNLYFINKNGELNIKPLSILTLKNSEKRKNELNKLEISDVHKIIEWNEYKNIPHFTIVKQMPLNEIPLYFKNNNAKNWFALRKYANQNNTSITDVQRMSLFGLAHGLGVFSENGKESEIAKNFILENILSKYSLAEIHQKVAGWDVPNTPYNSEFAKFFMQYFHSSSFFDYEEDKNAKSISNYLFAIHNRFCEIQEVFPHKKVQTRQNKDRLTPELVLDVISRIEYANVQKGCESLASEVKKFGYSQKEFEILQNWFIIGQKLSKSDMLIKIDDDVATFAIRYELLEKDNPLCAVLGNITNCCQVVNDCGANCVKYGMTKPNSTFVVFKDNTKIIGQAWIWYDAKSKQVTLDNIEVPTSYISKELRKKEIQNSFMACIERFCKNLMKKMNKNENLVNAVTVGLGYNKIGVELVKKYGIVQNPKYLSDYSNYSDSSKQSLICEVNQSNIEVKKLNSEEIIKVQENELMPML